jgi:hypothetical protein
MTSMTKSFFTRPFKIDALESQSPRISSHVSPYISMRTYVRNTEVCCSKIRGVLQAPNTHR